MQSIFGPAALRDTLRVSSRSLLRCGNDLRTASRGDASSNRQPKHSTRLKRGGGLAKGLRDPAEEKARLLLADTFPDVRAV